MNGERNPRKSTSFFMIVMVRVSLVWCFDFECFGRFYVSWFSTSALGSRSAYNEEVKYLASAKHLFIRSRSVVDFFLLLWLILFVLDVRIEGQPYHLLCRYYLFLAFHKNRNTHLRHIYRCGYIIKLRTRLVITLYIIDFGKNT